MFLYYRVQEAEEQNQMSASNLGIVFGPTLLRPRYNQRLNVIWL